MSTPSMTRKTLRAGLVLGLSVAAITACDPDRASLLEPFGDIALNFSQAPASAGAAKLPGGTLTLIRPAAGTDTARLNLRYLEPLTGGVYQVWLGRDTLGALSDLVPATGRLRVIRANASGGRDTVATPNVSSFNGVNDTTARYVLDFATNLGANPAKNIAIVTIEPAAGATSPSASGPKPLWAKFNRQASGAANVAVNFVFGNYSPDPAKLYAFPLVGRGRAAIRANQLFADDSSLGRPPVGYYFAAYSVGVDTATGAVIDTVALGELSAPWPRESRSLRDADVGLVDEVVSDRPFAIAASSLRYTGPVGFNWVGYSTVLLSLKNKQADAAVLPPNRVLVGNVPTSIAFP